MVADTGDFIGREVAGGRYKVLDKIGGGGMAVVYKALDRNLNYEVVLKVPRPIAIQDERFRARFLAEIRSLVRLNHAHIVRVLDAGEHEGWPYAVLQYLAGGSLRERARGPGKVARPMSLAEVGRWLLPVADALDFIHGQGIIHRDVKPDNIMFDQHGNAFLGDFGIVKVLGSPTGTGTQLLTAAGQVLGTPQYMAPEVLQDRPFTGAADQYSLGVTVHELLTGRNPMAGLGLSAIIAQHIKEGIPALGQFVPGLPPHASGAVDRAVARDAGRRFASCGEFARAVLGAGKGSASVSVSESGRVAACPSCTGSVLLPPSAIGCKVRCPRCKASFVVRHDGEVELASAIRGPGVPPPLPPPPPSLPGPLDPTTFPDLTPPMSGFPGETQPFITDSASTTAAPLPTPNRPPPPRLVRPSASPPHGKRRRRLFWGAGGVGVILLAGLVLWLWPRKEAALNGLVIQGKMDIDFPDRKGPLTDKATYKVNLQVRHGERMEVSYEGDILFGSPKRENLLQYTLALIQQDRDAPGDKFVRTQSLGNINGKARFDDDGYDFSELERLLGGGGTRIKGKVNTPPGAGGRETYQFQDLTFPRESALGLPEVVVKGALEYENTRRSFTTKKLIFDYGDESDHLVGTIQWVKVPGAYLPSGAKVGDRVARDDKGHGKSEYVIKIAFRPSSLPSAQRDALEIGAKEAYLSGEIQYRDWGKIHPFSTGPRILPDGSEVTFALHANRLTPRQVHTFLRVWLLLARPINDEESEE